MLFFVYLRNNPGLKGTRWLLLKNPENLTEDPNERARLEEALSLNKPLAAAYYMKEDLRLLWSQPDKATAQAHLDDWIARAEASGICMLKDFATTLGAHRRGILAYYDYPITTGPLEGTNNKIKTLQRQAYGFRDQSFFILRIYALHTTRYALVGCGPHVCGTHLRENPIFLDSGGAGKYTSNDRRYLFSDRQRGHSNDARVVRPNPKN